MIYTYNDIPLTIVRTNNILYEAIFSQDQTTYLYTHYIFNIQGIINPDAMSFIINSSQALEQVPGVLPATTIAAIRHALLQPRGQFIVTDDVGNELMHTPDAGFFVDAKDGPKPLSCHITQISGSKTVTMRWEIEGWIRECYGGEADPFILSNRWSDQIHINQHQLATHISAGQTVFNKAQIDFINFAPDDFRNQIFPGVPPGFRRTDVTIVQNSAGNELMWSVTDEEMMYNIGNTDPLRGDGSGILEIEGRQAIVGMKPADSAGIGPLGGQTFNQIFLRATGSYYSDQWTMIERLIQFASQIVPFGVEGYYIVDAQVARSLGQRQKYVEIQFVVLNPPAPNLQLGNLDIGVIKIDVWDAIARIVNQGIQQGPELLLDGSSRGSSPQVLLTQALTAACGPRPGFTGVANERNDEPLVPNDEGTPKIKVYTRDILPEVPSNYDTTPYPYSYTKYQVETEYKTNMGIKQAPIAGPTTGTPVYDPNIHDYVLPPTSALFQVHAPIATLQIRGIAERIGDNPVMPAPVSADPNFFLTYWYISPSYPIINPGDGLTPITRCEFYMEYAMLSPPNPLYPSFIIGKLPWTTIPPEVASLGPQNFAYGITGVS